MLEEVHSWYKAFSLILVQRKQNYYNFPKDSGSILMGTSHTEYWLFKLNAL
jgi:hypothetical protein